MADAKIIPYTEDELYVVPVKEAKAPSAKVVTFPAHRATAPSTPPPAPQVEVNNQQSVNLTSSPSDTVPLSFFQEHKTVIITLAVIAVIIGAYCYYQHQQAKKNKEEPPK